MITREEFEKLEGWFWWEEAEVFRDALDNLKDVEGVIFEAGSYKGKSTAVLASCTKGDIYAVDPFCWDGGTFEKFKEQTAGHDNITAVKSDAVEYKDQFDKPIKLLFIDCDHSYELTKRIYELYEPLVVDGGIILLHDCSPLNHDLSNYDNSKSNEPIPSDPYAGWIGPTQVLQEIRKKHKIWIQGAGSLHGIKKGNKQI